MTTELAFAAARYPRARSRLFLSMIAGLFVLTACDWWPAKRENEPLDKAANAVDWEVLA